ncbi:MAG: hypothetical protein KAV82_09435 [Phycisphaerae bacterium]|nr:hypothetical protein [Phycisphaerae bacterium]
MNHVVLHTLIVMMVCISGPASAGTPAGEATSTIPQSFAAELAYLDANGNGSIDAFELARGRQMALMLTMLPWETCDRDGDGTATPVEFQAAASEALQELLSSENQDDTQAQEALARAIPASVLLRQLGSDQSYADELAALREVMDDLDDDDKVVTHIISNSALYPRLSPVVRTWVRYYPTKPQLHRHVGPRAPRFHTPARPHRPHVSPRPVPKRHRPATARPGKPARPAAPKPAPRRGR